MPRPQPLAVGQQVEVEIGPIAHGGHCIAHHAGRTLLVRHAIPGERVVAEVTAVASKVSRADAIEVVEASPDRVVAACAYAHPGGCGGCDFQHVDLGAQRRLKEQVIVDALRRFAGLPDVPVQVEGLDSTGLGWRTRVTWHVDPLGHLGFHPARSHAIIDVSDCALASPRIAQWRHETDRLLGAREVTTVEGSDGRLSVLVDGRLVDGPELVSEEVAGRRWRLTASGFWQVHPLVAEALVEAVLGFAQPRPGERWWDLYAGAGLFTAFLAEAVGPTGSVLGIEGDDGSVHDGRRALADLPSARMERHDVRRWLAGDPQAPDGVVLDPPRSGAGAEVIERIAAVQPTRIVYVACDPVALARDVRLLADAGYHLAGLRAFDAFPMTHHVECVAWLTRS